MRLLISIVVLFGLAAAGVLTIENDFHLPKLEHLDSHIHGLWTKFKTGYGFVYNSTKEELTRFQIFTNHVKMIIKHNFEHDLGLHTFRLGINRFAAMVNDEFFFFDNFSFLICQDKSRISK